MLVQGGPPNKISNAGWFITRLARVYGTNSFTYIYIYILVVLTILKNIGQLG